MFGKKKKNKKKNNDTPKEEPLTVTHLAIKKLKKIKYTEICHRHTG